MYKLLKNILYLLDIEESVINKSIDKYYPILEKKFIKPKVDFKITPQNIQVFAMSFNILSIMSGVGQLHYSS